MTCRYCNGARMVWTQHGYAECHACKKQPRSGWRTFWIVVGAIVAMNVATCSGCMILGAL